MADCLRQTLAGSAPGPVAAICPHATGTVAHGQAELAALGSAFGQNAVPPGILLKPYTGHTLGASGLLDIALLAGALKRGIVPGNLSGLNSGRESLKLPPAAVRPAPSARIIKLSVGMGGHNASISLRTME
jgi:3-oxoacyl-(acyl-carrier-protein) synthase